MAELSEIERISGEAEQATSAGDHAAAERALRRVLRLQEAGLGLSHPDVANTLNDLGVVCDRLGRPDEAEFLYRRALGIARRTLAPEHPYIATSLENLSNLYRAQGKPEKLAKVRDGRSPGSGMPEVGWVDEASDDEAEAPGGTASETPVAPAPVTDVQSGTDRRRPGSWRDWLVRPAVLSVGAGVALLSVLWLLLGGNPDPAGLGQTESQNENQDQGREDGQSDGAGTRLQAAGSEPTAGGGDRSTRPASSESLTRPTTDRADDPTDSGIDRSVSAPGDRSASTPALPTDPLPTSASEASSPDGPPAARRPDSNPVAVTTPSVVVAAAVCSELETRASDGVPLAEWRCEPVVGRAGPGRLFFYTRVRSRTRATVEHRWLRNGVLEQQVDLSIEANDGPGYRTYSSHTVSSGERGAWRVELRFGDQGLLHAEEFAVP